MVFVDGDERTEIRGIVCVDAEMSKASVRRIFVHKDIVTFDRVTDEHRPRQKASAEGCND